MSDAPLQRTTPSPYTSVRLGTSSHSLLWDMSYQWFDLGATVTLPVTTAINATLSDVMVGDSSRSSLTTPGNWSAYPTTNDSQGAVNGTETVGSPYSLPEVILIAFFAGLLSITTIVGNVMVMISFKMDKQLQTISNYFLLSLAIADFSIGLVSMPLFTMYILTNKWPLGPFICDTWLAFDYLTSNASVLNLLIISFDRYFSVTRPLTYRARRTTKRAAIMIASAWLISLVLWPPWIYSWPYIEGQRSVPEGQCYIQFLETNSYVTFGTAIAAFYVPVTVMCILYWRIWRETEKRQKDLTHLQAGKKNGSRKSTSSDDPAESEDFRRGRSDSCMPEEATETTYVPTSLCVETSKYLPTNTPKSRQQRLKDVFLSWCRIDRDMDKEDDDSTSHGSPGAQTPASIETPIQSASRTTSMNFRADQMVQLNPSGSSTLPSRRSEVNIPMTDRNGLRRAEGPGGVGNVGKPSTSRNPASRSYSSDSVYTILIRLPTQPSIEGEGESQASIKMILEEEGPEAETRVQSMVRTSENTTTWSGNRSSVVDDTPSIATLRQGSLKTCDSGLETIRIPLNTKLVHKQVAKTRAPKKKRKQQERKQEKKAAKTLSAILLAFIVTWTPYNVLVLIKTLSQCESQDCIPLGLWNFVYYLCYINSTVNPLCYALCNANFRRTYIRILSCKWHNKQRNMNRGYFS